MRAQTIEGPQARRNGMIITRRKWALEEISARFLEERPGARDYFARSM
jgi:hypothetical protein